MGSQCGGFITILMGIVMVYYGVDLSVQMYSGGNDNFTHIT